MKKVLIVDDDNLARKGLISLLPWQEYNMKICGEASNGRKALEFLLNNNIDLMITDLEMPAMSGLELIEKVKERYPHIKIVVLSMHEEFPLVQQSYRLGILDYIAKNQLEREQLHQVLERINKKMEEIDNKKKGSHSVSTSDYIALCFLSENTYIDKAEMTRLTIEYPLVKINSSLWFSPLPTALNSEEVAIRLGNRFKNKEYIVLLLKDNERLNRSGIEHLLEDYCNHGLFYDYKETAPYHRVFTGDLYRKKDYPNYDVITKVEKKLLSLDWLYIDKAYDEMIGDIEKMRITPPVLLHFIHNIKSFWSIYKKGYINTWDWDKSHFLTWSKTKKWFEHVRREEERMRKFLGITGEGLHAMAKAYHIMKEEYSHPLGAEEVAYRVNLSRSHFNELFKKVHSCSFLEKLTQVRLHKAMELLSLTELSIEEIAHMVGYSDEKYFSRLFKKNTDFRPSEFKKKQTMINDRSKGGD